MLGLLLYSSLSGEYDNTNRQHSIAVAKGVRVKRKREFLDFKDGWFREVSSIPSELMGKEK